MERRKHVFVLYPNQFELVITEPQGGREDPEPFAETFLIDLNGQRHKHVEGYVTTDEDRLNQAINYRMGTTGIDYVGDAVIELFERLEQLDT